MEALFSVLLWTALAPAIVSGGLLLLTRQPWRSPENRSPAPWGAALAIGFGYIVGHWGLRGAPYDSVDVTRLLVYIAALGAFAGSLEAIVICPKGLCRIMHVMLSFGCAWWTLSSRISAGWTTPESFAWSLAVACQCLAVWFSLERTAESKREFSALVSWLVLTVAGSGCLVLSGTATAGQLAGILAASIGPLLVVNWFFPQDQPSLASATPTIALLSCSQWAVGFFYADMPLVTWLLLGVAGVALSLIELERFSQLGLRMSFVLRIVSVALPSVSAAGLAATHYFEAPDHAQTEESSSSSDDDYGY